MKNKYLKEALEETVKEIQGYSEEELERKLSKSKYSITAKTVDGIAGFAGFTKGLSDETIQDKPRASSRGHTRDK